ncbi:MAG TPA: UDP-3-O-(3-hydroxymyristoyl)glucosamine N-acyltransferase [Tepidisphaeraceae bacterium]|nr:UDP-3-O-(3-hydroxymyristoyl)glucosamine N-acyltransferase [Tepidisphaeraceae bacterium]
MKKITLGQIASVLGCPPPSGLQADIVITGVASLAEARPGEISCLSTDAYVRQFQASHATAVVVDRKVKRPPAATADTALLTVDDADLAIARVLELFAPPVPRPPRGIDSSARLAPTAKIGDNVSIGPFVVIGEGSSIGGGTVLHAGVYIGDDVQIGDHCEFFPHVTVRERISIGSRVIIHANSVLGTDGFGYRWDGAVHAKIPQIGTVEIEDDVEIGSCVCIDRAKFASTKIGRGSKIDNLVQIGHNVVVGPHCIICGQAGIAGSARLGTGVVLGGQAAVRDHATIGDQAAAAACAAIAEDVPPKTIVSGMPAFPHRQSLREQAALRRLPDLVVQVRKLQEKIDELTREQSSPGK